MLSSVVGSFMRSAPQASSSTVVGLQIANCPTAYQVIPGHHCSSSPRQQLWFLTRLSCRLRELRSDSASYCSARRPILFGTELSTPREVNKLRHDPIAIVTCSLKTHAERLLGDILTLL